MPGWSGNSPRGAGQRSPLDASLRCRASRAGGGDELSGMKSGIKTVKLRLPATSANLGPGFDAMALALELFLEIEAAPAHRFSITATGRNQNICGGLHSNLLIQTYESVLAARAAPGGAAAISACDNGIPVGMGCGSSAAVRLAGSCAGLRFRRSRLGRGRGSSTRPRGWRGIRITWRPAGMVG